MPNLICSVGPCDNRSWKKEENLKKNHVEKLAFHSFPADEEKRSIWIKMVSRGRKDFKLNKQSCVCSNHFQKGKPTFDFPNPTLFLTPHDAATKKSPKKRALPQKKTRTSPRKAAQKRTLADQESTPDPKKQATDFPADFQEPGMSSSLSKKEQDDLGPGLTFEQLSREQDVKLYTGFEATLMFQLVFNHLLPLAAKMQYWKGEKETKREARTRETSEYEEYLFAAGLSRKRPGPSRKLTVEQEFLLVMMRLRCGLLVKDLAFRFKVASSLVTFVFFTWVRLMAAEFKGLIVWADRDTIRRNHPDSFRKFYPKCRVIIDCTELYIETPSSLETAAACWSQYKHHYTVKFLVGITPNDAISFLSSCYGGRATDIFITEDCGIARKLSPGDQVMADRGFKIKDLLAYHQCTLTIPPSTVSSMQMSQGDVKKTCKIANVRIFVEKAIRRIKEYRLLKIELPILQLPLVDEIVTICAAFTNLKNPLLEQ